MINREIWQIELISFHRFIATRRVCQSFFSCAEERVALGQLDWTKSGRGWYLTLEWPFLRSTGGAPGSFPCAFTTASPCSSPGRWCVAPLCCLRSRAGRRSAGRWAAGRWGGCRRPARGRSVSGGLPRAGGRTVRPTWPAAAGSSPRLSAGPARGWAPRRSPPPESRWSCGAAPSWRRSSSSPVTP